MKNLNILKKTKLLAILLITSLTISSCSDDDHGHDHGSEGELITTVTYTLTNTSNANDVVTFIFDDLDGDGSIQPVITDGIDAGALTANATYNGVIKLENKTQSPAEDITIEVRQEGNEHEFFYTSTVSGININKTDTDANNNPIGIQTTLTTGTAGSGSLTIILKHEPMKPNNNTSASAGGSTDVQVIFDVVVQ